MDGEDLVTIKSVKMLGPGELDKVTPGSEIILHLDLESHFPQVFSVDSILISLTYSDPTSLSVPDETDKRSKRMARTLHKQKVTR